jgi:hypothetical protein
MGVCVPANNIRYGVLGIDMVMHVRFIHSAKKEKKRKKEKGTSLHSRKSFVFNLE